MADLRFVLRVLARTPGFTITVVLALAVGIGASTAIFSLVNGVLLRPLPYPESQRLVMVWQDYTSRGGPVDEWASPGNVRDWRAQTGVFESVSALGGWNAAAAFDGGAPEALRGEQVTYEYFTTLGLAPAAGRWFESREDIPGAPRAVVLSHGLWQARFGGDPAVIGRTLQIGDEPHEIVGVAPEGTRGVLNADAALWRPIRLNLGTPTYDSVFLRVIARLAPDTAFDGAQSTLRAMAPTMRQDQMANPPSIFVQRAQEWIVGDARLPLLVLMAAVLTLLALTVANIANLVLARASAREREFSVRAAIGASRGRLVRLMILESVTLSIIGGLVGVLVGAWALSGLVTLVSDFLPRAAEVRLDGRALAFTALVAAVAGVLFGLAPSLQFSRPDLQSPLRESRGTTSRRGQLARKGLVVAQIALALVILASAGLIVRSFSGMRQADLGFEPNGVAVGTVALAGSGYRTNDQVLAFLRQMEERLPAVAGVENAAFTSILPLAAGGDSDTSFTIVGQPARLPNGRGRVSWYRSVSAGYFDAIGMHMARGRAIARGAREAVVNETFAKQFFPGTDAVGQQLVVEEQTLTIVGIAADAKTRGPRNATRNEMFLPYEYLPEPTYALVARARAGLDPLTLLPSMRALVSEIDPKVPLARPSTMDELHGDALAQPRLLAVLLAAFAGAALLLALLGIYGVIAYAVGQRTSEMGIRLALGATPREIVRLVLADGVKLSAMGVVLGIAGAVAASGAIGTLLYGIEPRDPLTFAGAIGVIAVTALFGSWLPARRASRTAPTEALRA
ncbi:MAG: ABC transporter permease [Acidobacteriota bacterium]|nr:ABC transporter permease [Acidobacteriota bacterium]